MAGHMGDRNRTQQNLEIVHTDAARGLLFVKGSVPGSKGGWLIVKDAVKVDRHPDAPFPAGLRSAKHDEEPSVVEIDEGAEIGRADVLNPVTNAQLVCRLLLEK